MSDSSESMQSMASKGGGHVTMRRAHKARVSTSDPSKFKIKVPSFSPEDPELWFALLEGQFETHGVTEDSSKFIHVTNNLDLQYAKAVKDIIVKPPAEKRYDRIKAELIKRLSASHEKKVKQLLTHEELGDRKPSQFLRHLQDLAGPSVPDDFLRSIWCNRLPHNIQTVLASQSSQSLEQLADLADRIQELTSPYNVVASTHNPSRPPPSEDIMELKKMVQQLTLKLEEHTRGSCCSARQPRPQRQSTSRQRSRSNSCYKKYPMCWYHSKFGDKAHNCIKPCDFSSKPGNARGNR